MNLMIQKITYIRFLLPSALALILVLDGLTGYIAPDPFDGLEVITQPAFAAEAPELEIMEQTGVKTEGKAPPGGPGTVDESGEYKDGIYTGSAQGFGGPIKVSVTIKDGKIVNISILSASGESSSYLARAKAVINRMLKKNSTNVDAVSGATYSSNGIIRAVRNALSKAKKTKSKSGNKKSKTSKPATKNPQKVDPVTGGTWADGMYEGEGEGFSGKLKVRVTIKDGKITSVELIETLDDPAFMNKAKNGVLPAIVDKQGTDVDTVTGATFSSNGLLAAVNDALKKAAAAAEQSGDTGNNGSGESGQSGSGDGGQSHSGTDSGGDDEDAEYEYKDGTYSRTVACTRNGLFDYDVNVVVKITDGRIHSITVTKGDDYTDEEYQEDNDEYLANAAGDGRSGMIGRILDAQDADVDTVTGATYSSRAIRSAVQDILSGIRVKKEKTEDQKPEEQQDDEAGDVPTDDASPENASPETADAKVPTGAYADDSPDSDAEESHNTAADQEVGGNTSESNKNDALNLSESEGNAKEGKSDAASGESSTVKKPSSGNSDTFSGSDAKSPPEPESQVKESKTDAAPEVDS